jgi:hypothetical protein
MSVKIRVRFLRKKEVFSIGFKAMGKPPLPVRPKVVAKYWYSMLINRFFDGLQFSENVHIEKLIKNFVVY